ncbi:hypothetical protein XENOCAPTIV_019646 [Xenoophorus captivus]|uniref:Uncharacterized protein n=1 Tax=Xenoophorus captivus TaxID=1517983 RepID=A0ABV0S7Z9_9TELE
MAKESEKKKLSLMLSVLHNNSLHVSGFSTAKQKLRQQKKALHKQHVQFSSKARFPHEMGADNFGPRAKSGVQKCLCLMAYGSGSKAQVKQECPGKLATNMR